MRLLPGLRAALLAAAWLSLPAPAAAQLASCPVPSNLPPADSGPLYRCVQFVFHPVNESVIDPNTYQYYLKYRWSLPSENRWVPWDEEAVQADFWNLWRLGFLDDLWVEVRDDPYPNGVPGKHVLFHMEERSRVKVVDYVGSRKVGVTTIEEALRDRGIVVRLDSFVDDAIIRRVKGVIRELYAEKGHHDAEITTSMRALPGGPKLVHLTFAIAEGPRIQIREIVFDGNEAFGDGKLGNQMKENQARGWLSFITDTGTYRADKFADDAQAILEYYRDRGYVQARVGAPKIETIEDSKDGTTRWVRLRIPIDEGRRYRVGSFAVAESSVLKPEFLRSLFKIKEGEYYSEKKIRKGIEKAREAYGALGFVDWVPDYDFVFSDDPARPGGPPADGGEPTVGITMKMDEGRQYFVNRITFAGNTTTRDNVIRREIRLLEGGVFNAEALKFSIRRLNQLGYFKPLEGKEGELSVEKPPDTEGLVDVRLNLEEQNRNQLAFGAGVSQFDGFFGQLSFQTSNFLGRGETLGVSLQKGSQARNYQISFSEPYMFDRPITVGADVFARQIIYPLQYTHDSRGTNLVLGLPLTGFSRIFIGYSYEEVRMLDISPAYLNPAVLASSPFLRDALLIDQGGRRIVSKISPSVVYNTINEPIFPSSGQRYSLGVGVAGLGGNTSYLTGRAEGIWYIPATNRTYFGLRVEASYIRPFGQTRTLPIFERIFQGGEYSIRGFDIRTVGPRDLVSGLVIGGNKSILFNAEYLIRVAGPVRLLVFYDAGQVRDLGQPFAWQDRIVRQIVPPQPLLSDPFAVPGLLHPGTEPPKLEFETIGRTSAFRTSTGFEVRFFMPVLNVPFRLIGAYNPQRFGVINNSGVLTPRFVFRFAVGTTF